MLLALQKSFSILTFHIYNSVSTFLSFHHPTLGRYILPLLSLSLPAPPLPNPNLKKKRKQTKTTTKPKLKTQADLKSVAPPASVCQMSKL